MSEEDARKPSRTYYDLICPHCGKDIETVIEYTVELKVGKSDYESWLAHLHPEDQDTVQLAEKLGIVALFDQVFKIANPTSKRPRNPAKAFLGFLHRPSLLDVDRHPALKLAIESQFPDARSIAILQHSGLPAIVVDDLLQLFVPQSHLRAPQVAHDNGKLKLKEITAPMTRLEEWIKTRNGYVPLEARTFFAEIKKRRPGQFANLGNF